MPPFLDRKSYLLIVKQILHRAEIVAKFLFKKAVKEEIQQTCEAQNMNDTTELTVSGDGTSQKRGFTSYLAHHQ